MSLPLLWQAFALSERPDVAYPDPAVQVKLVVLIPVQGRVL
jgi:hypothetical protein